MVKTKLGQESNISILTLVATNKVTMHGRVVHKCNRFKGRVNVEYDLMDLIVFLLVQ